MPEVFISHSSKNKNVADAVCAVLEQGSVRCWVAPRDVPPGMEWGEAVLEGIASCRIMLIIFSQDANESPQVRREVERAVAKGLIVIPFRIEDIRPTKAMEYFISASHWLDAFTPPLEGHLGRLTETILGFLGRGRPAAEVEPTAAAEKVNPVPTSEAAGARPVWESRAKGRRGLIWVGGGLAACAALAALLHFATGKKTAPGGTGASTASMPGLGAKAGSPAATQSGGATSPVSRAERAALENMLLSCSWFWNDLGAGSFPWTSVAFWSDGTMTTGANATARWTVIGSHTVALQFNTGDQLTLTFQPGFGHFAGSRYGGKDVVSGSVKSSNAALTAGTGAKSSGSFSATPTPQPAIATTVPTDLRAALVDYIWMWDDTISKIHCDPSFRPNGNFHILPGKPCHWSITGPLTVHVVLETGYQTTLTFDKSLSTFTNGHQLSGRRMGKRPSLLR